MKYEKMKDVIKGMYKTGVTAFVGASLAVSSYASPRGLEALPAVALPMPSSAALIRPKHSHESEGLTQPTSHMDSIDSKLDVQSEQTVLATTASTKMYKTEAPNETAIRDMVATMDRGRALEIITVGYKEQPSPVEAQLGKVSSYNGFSKGNGNKIKPWGRGSATRARNKIR